jgi:hypothetical protein
MSRSISKPLSDDTLKGAFSALYIHLRRAGRDWNSGNRIRSNGDAAIVFPAEIIQQGITLYVQ